MRGPGDSIIGGLVLLVLVSVGWIFIIPIAIIMAVVKGNK